MNEHYDLIKKIITDEGYKVEEEEIDEFITVRYQLNSIHVCPTADVRFVSVILPNFAEVNEENYPKVVMCCNKLNEELKQVKLFTINDTIIAAYEFFFMEEEDLAFHIEQAMHCLIEAKVAYHKLEKER